VETASYKGVIDHGCYLLVSCFDKDYREILSNYAERRQKNLFKGNRGRKNISVWKNLEQAQEKGELKRRENWGRKGSRGEF